VRALEDVLSIVSLAIFAYFVLYVIATFTLITLSAFEVMRVKVEHGERFMPPRRLRRPGISLIAPAYNCEPVIVASAQSLLACDYEPLEVIVVDDSSDDGTAEALATAFDLVELPVGDRLQIPTARIHQILVSRKDPRLRVVRKDNGGRSDAINAGLNVAFNELVAFLDADTLLERDALKRIGEVFALDPDSIVAVGGTVRIANGARIENGAVAEARVSQAGLEASQAAEYLRSFLGGRIAWSRLNALVIISGAFGVFRREVVHATGGLSHETLGEDMELVMRLHHQLRAAQPDMRILVAADANVWTEVPNTLAALRTQRIRWHVGLFDNLRMHREMILARQYGGVGLLALPYTLLFEGIGPLMQVGGYAIVITLLLLHDASWTYAVAFAIISVLVGQLQTAGAILIEEIAFRRYRVSDLIWLAGWSLLEFAWFRPLTALWRCYATLLVVVGRRPGWGTIPRGVAFRADSGEELVSAPLPR
jgi:cellulose synthase/poly-beta-1,6-N-acetylglucosamine synthase-like glycosyltransferase